jgi:hypothetical protein
MKRHLIQLQFLLRTAFFATSMLKEDRGPSNTVSAVLYHAASKHSLARIVRAANICCSSDQSTTTELNRRESRDTLLLMCRGSTLSERTCSALARSQPQQGLTPHFPTLTSYQSESEWKVKHCNDVKHGPSSCTGKGNGAQIINAPS